MKAEDCAEGTRPMALAAELALCLRSICAPCIGLPLLFVVLDVIR